MVTYMIKSFVSRLLANINLIQTKILNDLFRLVSKNPAVKVNGEKRGIDVSTYEKYLEMSIKYLIEESDKISVDEK